MDDPSDPMLAGNVAALLSPVIYIPILTYAFGPDNYDWQSMKEIRRGDDKDFAEAAHIDLERLPGAAPVSEEAQAIEQAKLKKASRIAWTMTGTMTLILLVIWPMPLYGTGYVFSKPFFTGWCSVGILWLFFSAGCVGLYPLWEGRKSMARSTMGIWKDLTGKRGAVLQGRMADVEDDHSDGKATTVEEKAMVKD